MSLQTNESLNKCLDITFIPANIPVPGECVHIFTFIKINNKTYEAPKFPAYHCDRFYF